MLYGQSRDINDVVFAMKCYLFVKILQDICLQSTCVVHKCIVKL